MSIETGPGPDATQPDLRTKLGVVALMRSSRTLDEYEDNCNEVMAAYLPVFGS